MGGCPRTLRDKATKDLGGTDFLLMQKEQHGQNLAATLWTLVPALTGDEFGKEFSQGVDSCAGVTIWNRQRGTDGRLKQWPK